MGSIGGRLQSLKKSDSRASSEVAAVQPLMTRLMDAAEKVERSCAGSLMGACASASYSPVVLWWSCEHSLPQSGGVD